MKIILYLILIIIVVLMICGIYYGVSNADFTSVSDTINTVFDNAAEWVSDTVNDIGSLLGD